MNRELSLIAVVFLVANSFLYVHAAQKSQEPDREIVTNFLIQKYPFRVPVEITDLSIKGQHIELGLPIEMKLDALQHLRVTVKNVHDTPLIGVGVSVRFPYDEKRQPILPELELMAGNYAHFIDKRLDYDFSIAPGATFELSVNPSFYEGHKQQVQITPQAKFSTLLVQPTYAAVDINREWIDGIWETRDPKNSRRWLPDERVMQKLVSEIPLRFRTERASLLLLSRSEAFFPTECQVTKETNTLNCTAGECPPTECYQLEDTLADPPEGRAGSRWDNILRVCLKYGSESPPLMCSSSCKKKTKKLRFLDVCV